MHTAQTSQAKIEQSVARVRTEAMSMQQSDDLLKVVGMLLEELTDLGLNVPICFINYVVNADKGSLRSYRAFQNPNKLGTSWQLPEMIEIHADLAAVVRQVESVGSWWIDQWRTGEMWVRSCDIDEIFGVEPFYQDLIQHLKIEKSLTSFEVIDVPFAYGTIGLWSIGYGHEHGAIAQQFTEVIALGYRRSSTSSR